MYALCGLLLAKGMVYPVKVFLPTYQIPSSTCITVLSKRIENWSLTSLQHRLVKTGGRLVRHARYYWLMFAQRVT